VNKILVSIVIPYYNDSLFIEEAYKSALNQTYKNTEIIIVNDGSTESESNVLNRFKESKLKVLYQVNKGLSAARNTGIKNSKGQFILLLDSDDKYDKYFIEEAISILLDQKNIGAVSSWGYRFTKNNIKNIFKPTGKTQKDFLFANAAIGTSLIRKECWEKIGGYDENMRDGYEDWEFYIRLTEFWNVQIIEKPLFYYRQKNNSMRLNALRKHDYKIKQYIFKKHKDIYIENYDFLINELLESYTAKKIAEKKLTERIEFKIGAIILKPLKGIKKFFKNRNNG